MKEENLNKGITLVALVITVIVLLILAGTAVSIAVNGGDLFGKTQNAVTKYNAKAGEQNETVTELWEILETLGQEEEYGLVGNVFIVREIPVIEDISEPLRVHSDDIGEGKLGFVNGHYRLMSQSDDFLYYNYAEERLVLADNVYFCYNNDSIWTSRVGFAYVYDASGTFFGYFDSNRLD